MDNYTTFETSVKLKEKGFPQPEPVKCQVWHGKEGAYQVMTVQVEDFGIHESTVYCHRVGSTQVFDMSLNLFKKFIYAPTPADILKELGPPYSLTRDTSAKNEKIWLCLHEKDEGFGWYHHENPAEACALAFMDK